MKPFKSTAVFLLLVALLIGYAVYDFQMQNKKEQQAIDAKKIYPELSFESLQTFKMDGPQKLNLEKIQGRWHITEPLSDLANQQQVQIFLEQIIEQEVLRIPEEEASNKDQYGFEPGLARFVLSDESQVYEFAIGSVRTFDDGYYIKKIGVQDLFVGSSGWTNIYNQLAESLRNKHLYLNSSDIRELSIKSKKGDFKLVNERGLWLVDKDLQYPLAQESIEDYLTQITTLQADEVKDTTAPNSQPELTLQAVDKDKKPWLARIWKPKDKSAVVQIDSKNTIYYVDVAKVSFLDRSLNELKDKTVPFQFVQNEVASVILNSKNYIDEVVEVNRLVEKIANFKVSTYGVDLSKKLTHSLELLDKQKKSLFKMSWSDEFERGGSKVYLVSTNRHLDKFTVASSLINDLSLMKDIKETDKNE